ncbi:MAG: 3-deoxy-8-phosphooctulonate synthase [Pseudomonadota bacterium]|nr:3-deoxy-8-phosphooctulonate synthase [Pseudomonadota bacterium]
MQMKLHKWNIAIGDGAPLVVMAGLNVLEDKALALEVCAELKSICADLGLPYIFKASFDKANRSSVSSYRGPGEADGLAILTKVKATHNVPVVTDLHTPAQAEPVAAIADVVQLPAFLVRQTDLVVAAAKAVGAQQGWLHVKKAQFLAPWDCANIITKAREVSPDVQVILCERGTSFGYNNLIVDLLGIAEMKKLGVPVTMDATHAVQLPGADPRTKGASTGGRREGVPVLAKAAVAAGANGVFLEFHPEPDSALCDALSCLPLSSARDLISQLKVLHEAVN